MSETFILDVVSSQRARVVDFGVRTRVEATGPQGLARTENYAIIKSSILLDTQPFTPSPPRFPLRRLRRSERSRASDGIQAFT